MARMDIEIVVERTRTILTQPDTVIQSTNDPILDTALADLGQRTRENRPLELPRLGFWDAPTPPEHDRRR